MKIREKSTFLTCYFVLVCFTLAGSGIIYSFEFVYGNADGVWFDRDIIRSTFYLVVLQSALGFVIYSLFFLGELIQNITISVLTTVFLIWGIERVCEWLVMPVEVRANAPIQSIPFEREDYRNVSLPDDTLGVRATPNWHVLWAPVKDGVHYDTLRISIDSLSRRITPAPLGTPNEYALFLGCSYTYGDGVSDHQTLPFYFQTAAAGAYRAYNYGFMAYSPLHALARLQHEPIRPQIREEKGFAVFTYINDHIDRVIPATRWIALTKGKFPYLEKSSMRTEGVFWKKRRLYTSSVLNLQDTGIRQYFNMGYPKVHTRAHFQLVVDILRQTRTEYMNRFGNDRFYVVIFPGNPLHPQMKELLDQSGIAYFDYSGLCTLDDNMLPFDNTHPAPFVYKKVAERLTLDLKKLQNNGI